MKLIRFQSKASFVCSVTTAVFIDFSLTVFSQNIGKKYINILIPQNKSQGIEIII